MTESKHPGAEAFLAASDKYFARLAKLIDTETEKEHLKLEDVREIAEIIKITMTSIKASSDEKKAALSPMDKTKARKAGAQVSV